MSKSLWVFLEVGVAIAVSIAFAICRVIRIETVFDLDRI